MQFQALCRTPQTVVKSENTKKSPLAGHMDFSIGFMDFLT